MISKKEIQNKVEESVSQVIKNLEIKEPTKKIRNSIKKSSKKLAGKIKKDLKRTAKKTEKTGSKKKSKAVNGEVRKNKSAELAA